MTNNSQSQEKKNECPIMSAKEYVTEREWFRSEYFLDPETGEVYDYWKPAIHRVVKGLDRFLEAQDHNGTYQQALEEIRAGKKKTHWIWFVFPQMAGLGTSEKSQFYAIVHRGEAERYIEHPVLRARLIEATEAVYNNERTVYEIFGNDTIKVRCCMKLFASVSDIPVFKKMLEKYCWR